MQRVTSAQGAGKAVYRLLLERMSTERPLTRRVDFFYLADSILNKCARDMRQGGAVMEHRSGYPALVAAGLPMAVSALLEVPEGREKLRKVLKLWREHELLPGSVLEPAIARVEGVPLRQETAPASQLDVKAIGSDWDEEDVLRSPSSPIAAEAGR